MSSRSRLAARSLLSLPLLVLAGCSSSSPSNDAPPDASVDATASTDATDTTDAAAPSLDSGAVAISDSGPSDAAFDATDGASVIPDAGDDAGDAMIADTGSPIDAALPDADAGPSGPCVADDFQVAVDLPLDAGAPPVRKWCTAVPFAASPKLVAGGAITPAGALAAIGYPGSSETESVAGTVLSQPFALTFDDGGAPASAQIVGPAVVAGQFYVPTTIGGAFVTGGTIAALASGHFVLWAPGDAGAAAFVSFPASNVTLLPFPGGDVVLAGFADASVDFGKGQLGVTGGFAARFDAQGSCKWSTPLGAYPTGTISVTVDADGNVSVAAQTTADGGVGLSSSSGGIAVARFDSATGARQWLVNLGSTSRTEAPLLAPEGTDLLVLQAGAGLFHLHGADGSVNGAPADDIFSDSAMAMASDGAGGVYVLSGGTGMITELFHMRASGTAWAGFIWYDPNVASNPIVTPAGLFVSQGTLFVVGSATPRGLATAPSYLLASAYVGN